MSYRSVPMWFGFLTVCAALFITPVYADMAVGHVERMIADVYGVLPNEDSRNRKYLRYDVVVDETIQTDGGAAVLIQFKDGTTLTLGEKASLMIDDFVYDPNQASNTALYELKVGALRYISGEMHGQGVTILTPTTNIGIRGSDALIFVTPDGATVVNVYDGVFSVSGRDSAQDPVTVNAGENVGVSASRALSPVAPGMRIPRFKPQPGVRAPNFDFDFSTFGWEGDDGGTSTAAGGGWHPEDGADGDPGGHHSAPD